jgi:hypothetical protein
MNFLVKRLPQPQRIDLATKIINVSNRAACNRAVNASDYRLKPGISGLTISRRSFVIKNLQGIRYQMRFLKHSKLN